MTNPPEFITVTTNFADEESARTLLQHILEHRLAACGHLHAVSSSYWWQGEIHNEPEWVLSLKTRGSLYKKLEDAIRATHPYDVPMIVATPVADAYGPYADWLRDETSSSTA